MAKTDQIVDEIDATREHLASTIDQLIQRSHPKAIAKSGADNVKSKFVDETGSARLEVIGPIVGVIAGLFVLGWLVRKFLR